MARPTDLGPAAATYAQPAAAFAAHVLGLHQFIAAARRANDAASAGVLLVLLVPLLLEARVEQHVNKLGGNVISGATPWWHVLLWVSERELEDLAQTRMAHAMAAFELGRPAHRSVAIPAEHTHGSTKAQVRMANGAVICRTGTDRSAGFSGCDGRATGAANSAPKNVERFAEEPRL
jgi:hypothetical protein